MRESLNSDFVLLLLCIPCEARRGLLLAACAERIRCVVKGFVCLFRLPPKALKVPGLFSSLVKIFLFLFLASFICNFTAFLPQFLPNGKGTVASVFFLLPPKSF